MLGHDDIGDYSKMISDAHMFEGLFEEGSGGGGSEKRSKTKAAESDKMKIAVLLIPD